LPRSILIVDDNPVLRRCLRRLVEQNEMWNVCGEAENGQIAIEKVTQLTPDLVILDWQMSVMGGLEAARQITLVSPNTIIIMFTCTLAHRLKRTLVRLASHTSCPRWTGQTVCWQS
jgi:DNA-binding NarL/FixJ family response regulator